MLEESIVTDLKVVETFLSKYKTILFSGRPELPGVSLEVEFPADKAESPKYDSSIFFIPEESLHNIHKQLSVRSIVRMTIVGPGYTKIQYGLSKLKSAKAIITSMYDYEKEKEVNSAFIYDDIILNICKFPEWSYLYKTEEPFEEKKLKDLGVSIRVKCPVAETLGVYGPGLGAVFTCFTPYYRFRV
jgi:hypothetical protein